MPTKKADSSPRARKNAKKSSKNSASATTKRSRAGSSKSTKLSSRAVLREVEPGSTVECTHCGERVKFQAKMRHKQVICNVYVGRRWDRVEHFHAPCYDEADTPYGEPDTTPPIRLPKSARAAEAAKAS